MIPLYTSGQVRQFDRDVIERSQVPSIVLMENASKNIYQISITELKLDPDNDVIGIVCGKGNNGGDGYSLARHFLNGGYQVLLVSLFDISELSPDAAANYRILLNSRNTYPQLELVNYKSLIDLAPLLNVTVLFEAILGSGVKGPLQESLHPVIKKMNLLSARKIALDIPAGIDADTGSLTGDYSEYGKEMVFKADYTISLAAYKRGLFFGDGYLHSGKVIPADIGFRFDPELLPAEDYLVEPEDCFYSLPVKERGIHKYSGGRLLIIAGSRTYPGAAVLSAKAALKTGCGSVKLAVPSSVYTAIVSQLNQPELIIVQYDDAGKGYLIPEALPELKKQTEESDTLLIGPGLGRSEETVSALRELLKWEVAAVLDADGLNAISSGISEFPLNQVILTPHPGEFSRLTGKNIDVMRKDLLSAGKSFAEENNVILVYKDFRTIIFGDSGESFINTTGNQGLAKIGSGDVLAGMISGFYAQYKDREKAVISGVYLHGLAADILSANKTFYGYSASDIIDIIPDAIKLLRESVDTTIS
ncbi:MAG: NAD(P)H-hydrate dehydratase [Ignavibacteriaceae bacterium]|nr:NAD(P)H-hydrate dehydratase [Ignavibacteriaceae bacterium]